MKIAVGADPFGFELKEEIKKHLEAQGHEIIDLGTTADKKVLYIDASDAVATAVSNKEVDRGIVLCGTGMGVSIVANKHKGVYCALVESEWAARQCRLINNANVLALGGRIFGVARALDTVDTFIKTEWCQNFTPERTQNLSNLFNQVVEVESKLLK